MDENMKDQNQNMGQCDNCGRCSNCGGHGGRWMCGHRCFFPMRLVLGLIILVIVFWVGFKLGEFKGAYIGDSGFGLNNYSGNYGFRLMMNQPMMNQWGGYQTQTVPGGWQAQPQATPKK